MRLDQLGPEVGYTKSESPQSFLGTTGMESLVQPEMKPIRELITAMMECVIRDLQGRGITHCREAAPMKVKLENLRFEAEEFIWDDVSADVPWSFPWLCEELNIDVEWFREQVSNGSFQSWKVAKKRFRDVWGSGSTTLDKARA